MRQVQTFDEHSEDLILIQLRMKKGLRSREGRSKEQRMKDQGDEIQGALQAFVVLILVLCRPEGGGGPPLLAA